MGQNHAHVRSLIRRRLRIRETDLSVGGKQSSSRFWLGGAFCGFAHAVNWDSFGEHCRASCESDTKISGERNSGSCTIVHDPTLQAAEFSFQPSLRRTLRSTSNHVLHSAAEPQPNGRKRATNDSPSPLNGERAGVRGGNVVNHGAGRRHSSAAPLTLIPSPR